MDTLVKNSQNKQRGPSALPSPLLDEAKTLLEGSGGPYVTIYMPLHETGTDIRQDLITVGNLLRQGHKLLVERGLGSSEADKLLKPIRRSLGQELLEQHLGSGLVIFASSESFCHLSVPLQLKQQVSVGDYFHIRPLLPLIMGQSSFYIMALSLNKVKLLRSTRYSCTEVSLPEGVPRSLAEALKYEDFEQQHQLYSGTPSWGGRSGGSTGSIASSSALRAPGRPGAVFYGQQIGSDLKKDNIVRYLQQVDKSLHSLLRGESAPMVLAGVDYLLSIYREVNNYRYLVEEAIEGNADDKQLDQLRREAWDIVQPIFARPRHEATELYMHLKGTGETSNEVEEIVPAAHNGQIASLLVAEDAQQWGSFDPDSGSVSQHSTREAGDEDLLELAVTYTLSNSGAVYVLEPEGMPDKASAAALLRY